jgi:YbbR domain-containing protein
MEQFYLKTKRITATLPIHMTKELPLKVTFIAGDKVSESDVSYTIRPESVTVSGEAAALKDVDEITLGEMSLLDLIGAGARTFHTYAIIVPEGCTNRSGVSTATLEITFKDMATKTVTTKNLLPGNDVPAGKAVAFEDESLDVQIYGPSQSLQSITGESIQVTPNLDDYASASGSYSVPAEIAIPGYRKVGVLGTYSVQVLITDKASAASQNG